MTPSRARPTWVRWPMVLAVATAAWGMPAGAWAAADGGDTAIVVEITDRVGCDEPCVPDRPSIDDGLAQTGGDVSWTIVAMAGGLMVAGIVTVRAAVARGRGERARAHLASRQD